MKNTMTCFLLAATVLPAVESRARASVNYYTAIDVCELGGNLARSLSVNDSGQVTGYSAATRRAFLYSNGSMIDLLGPQSSGFSINNSGQVTGFSLIGNTYHAFLYSGGRMRDLGTFPRGTRSWGSSINDGGEITGWSDPAGDGAVHAFLYRNGSMIDLGTLIRNDRRDIASWGWSINRAGEVTGGSDSGASTHAFFFDVGGMIDLHQREWGNDSIGYSLNNHRQIVGTFDHRSGFSHAFLYDNGTMIDLGTLRGVGARALSINDSGDVTGYYFLFNPGLAMYAFLYSGGRMYDLNDLVMSGLPAGVHLEQANSISNTGWIAAMGSDGRAYLLAPRLRASCESLAFEFTIGGPNPPSQKCSITTDPSGLIVSATASTASGGNWLSASWSPAISPTTLIVGVDAKGLDVGIYHGNIALSTPDGATFDVRITLTVNWRGTILPQGDCTFVFDYTINGGNPSNQNCTVETLPGDLTLSASAWMFSNGNWESASWFNAVWHRDTKTLTVSVDATRLGAGNYYGKIALTAPGAATVNRMVTLRVGPWAVVTDCRSLEFSFDGGSNPPSRQCHVWIPEGLTGYVGTSGENWLSASLNQEESPAILTVGVDPARLGGRCCGNYEGLVELRAVGDLGAGPTLAPGAMVEVTFRVVGR